ncbi:hypothetical protein K8S19_12665 [bacterium]|nr:hypothetical protein [bacterium]
MTQKISVVMGIVVLLMGNAGLCTAAEILKNGSFEGYPIVFSVSADPIDLVAFIDPVAFHRAGPAMDVFSNQVQGHPRCTIESRGYATVHFTVHANMESILGGSGWIMGTTLDDVGLDQCVVAAIFTQPLTLADDPSGVYARDLNLLDFADNDVIGPMGKTATTDVLARDNSAPDPDDEEYVKGYNVTPWPDYAIRSLRFLFRMPYGWMGPVEDQMLVITIGAVVD